MSAFSVIFLLILGLLWRISNTVQPVSSWALDARTPTKSLWAGAAKPGDCASPELTLGSGPALVSHQNSAWLCLRKKPLRHPKCPLLTPAGVGVAESAVRLPCVWRKRVARPSTDGRLASPSPRGRRKVHLIRIMVEKPRDSSPGAEELVLLLILGCWMKWCVWTWAPLIAIPASQGFCLGNHDRNKWLLLNLWVKLKHGIWKSTFSSTRSWTAVSLKIRSRWGEVLLPETRLYPCTSLPSVLGR